MTSPWHALCITALLLTSTACGDDNAQPQPTTDPAPTADATEAAPIDGATLAQAPGQNPFGQPGLPPAPAKPVENLKEKVSYMIGRGFGQDMKQRNPEMEVDFDSARSGVTDAMGAEADKKLSYAIGLTIGGSLKRDEQEMDVDQLIEGIKAAIADKSAKSESYAAGFTFARGVKSEEIDVDMNVVVDGWKYGMDPEGDAKFTDEEMMAARMAFQQQMMEKAAARAKKAADENLAKAEAFLAENGKKEGVKTTASGLQYIVVKEGDGATPKPTDRVKAHYHGTLQDGTVFDSSVDRKEPLEIGVNQVIPAWTEALQLMKTGGKLKIFVSPKLGYGERESGPIPPNSLLVFDIELIEILEAPKAPAQPITPGG